MRQQRRRPSLPFREPAHWLERRRHGGSRHGRILAAIPAREVVREPGNAVDFVTGRTRHRAHVRRRDQTRPVASHTAPRERLPPGRLPQHPGVPPFRVPAAPAGRGCRHAEASNQLARPTRQGNTRARVSACTDAGQAPGDSVTVTGQRARGSLAQRGGGRRGAPRRSAPVAGACTDQVPCSIRTRGQPLGDGCPSKSYPVGTAPGPPDLLHSTTA